MQQAIVIRAARGEEAARRVAAAARLWAAGERGRFVLWLPVFMGAGALLYFGLRCEPPAWCGLAAVGIAAALAAGLACRGRLAGGLDPAAAPRAAALALLAGSCGFASSQFATWRALPMAALPSRAVVLTGVVHGVDLLPHGRRVTLVGVRLDPGAPPLARRVRIRLRDTDVTPLASGDAVRLRALLRPPAPPAYPGAWDLQRDAYFSGLGGSGYALGAAEVLQHATPGGAPRWWRSLRDAVARRFIEGLPGPRGAVAATLFTGNASAIPPDDRAAFRDSGLAHLLAVAGLHIGIVMGVALGVARRLLTLSERAALHWPCRQIAGAVALATGFLYLLLTGAHVPILRSFAMASLVTIGLVSGRRAVSLRGLAVAAAMLILLAPQEILGVSFQMSFSAVLALVAGYEALRPALDALRGKGGAWRKLLLHLVALALTSLLAGTASAPYGAYHFGHVQPYFVLANMVAVPLAATLVMPAGLAALALMPLHLEAVALLPMGWGIGAILWVGRAVSAWPAAVLGVPHMPAAGLAAVSLGIAWLGLWRSRARLLGLLPLFLGLASPALTRPPDILVSPDARLIGLRTADGMRLQSVSGASGFVREAWEQYWDRYAPLPFPAGAATEADLSCEPGWCRLRAGGGEALLVRRGARADASVCAAAAVVLGAEPARSACPAAVPLVDRFTVWRDGAHAIWLGADGASIVSDRAFRGARPWVPSPPRPRRPAPALPLAQSEPLPAEAE